MRCLLKHKLTTLLIIVVGLFISDFSQLSGQTIPDSVYTPRQLKKLAKRCEIMGDYYTALEYMKECNRKKGDNPVYTYYLAELFRKSKQYDSAIFYYSKPILSDNKKYPLRDFHLASMEMVVGKYEEAKKLLHDFRRSYKDGKMAKVYRSLARNLMEGCDSAMSIGDNQMEVYLYNLGDGVNTPQIEFSPYPLSADMILYGSLPIDSANVFQYSKDDAPVRQLKIAQKVDKVWQTKGMAEWGMNDPDFNTGNATLSPDGQRIYFTRCYQNWKYQVICHIFKMDKTLNGWSEPEKLNELIDQEEYTATQPAIATNPKDGTDVLYFISDRPGGKGGMDIWYSEYDTRKQTFKKPKNLGSKINSEGDEITPYYNPATQRLYFSSNGLPGLGGFDIYRTQGSGRQWEDIEHIGTPVNSSYNDLYLALNPDGNSGFFTSNRPGSQLLTNNTCCDDIYFFNWKLPQTIPSQGFVYQQSTEDIVETINSKFGVEVKPIPEGKALDNVPVFLYRKKKNGEKILIQSTKTINGKYNFNLERDKDYIVSIKNYGFFDKSINATTKEYLSDDTLKIRKTGISRIPDVDLTMYVYYESGKSKLSPENLAQLDSTVMFLFDLLPNAIIEIGSHTDNIGKEDFNLKLSKKRADDVVQYLKDKGVSEERLVAKGYGWSSPVAPNQFPDGTDNPEGRRLNRRTQIRIIGTLFPDDSDDE